MLHICAPLPFTIIIPLHHTNADASLPSGTAYPRQLTTLSLGSVCSSLLFTLLFLRLCPSSQALRALGSLIVGNAANRDLLASRIVGERERGAGEREGEEQGGRQQGQFEDGLAQVRAAAADQLPDWLQGIAGVGGGMAGVGGGEAALHRLLRVALHAATAKESSAADYVIRSFCEVSARTHT